MVVPLPTDSKRNVRYPERFSNLLWLESYIALVLGYSGITDAKHDAHQGENQHSALLKLFIKPSNLKCRQPGKLLQGVVCFMIIQDCRLPTQHRTLLFSAEKCRILHPIVLIYHD
ncbi:hypothetical protein TNIN_10671 [Trichonephila inaurata madagascariensis]|uniref:Uncharacterized protein n=1 Tax=Trichonephila inaurata madagascariensis TaxID=2747483 RepID=A0A8X7CQX8_9ARAC|nr:hypothetical protein TNIN_10671 [Trichonephila inaurata madagascariensis]